MARPAKSSRNTRDDILNASAQLFAERGFKATTVKDIAAAIGIKDASLYNHFKSKQAIFGALIERERAYVESTLPSVGDALTSAPGSSSAGAHMYLPSTAPSGLDAFSEAIMASYEPLFADKRIAAFRAMLLITQFESDRTAQLYRTLFIEQPLGELTRALESLIARKLLAQCNARVVAYELYGSVFLLIAQDASWTEAKPSIRAHLRSLERTYGTTL